MTYSSQAMRQKYNNFQREPSRSTVKRPSVGRKMIVRLGALTIFALVAWIWAYSPDITRELAGDVSVAPQAISGAATPSPQVVVYEDAFEKPAQTIVAEVIAKIEEYNNQFGVFSQIGANDDWIICKRTGPCNYEIATVEQMPPSVADGFAYRDTDWAWVLSVYEKHFGVNL